MANEPFMDRWTLNGTEVLLQDHGRDQANGVPVLDNEAKLPLTYLPQNYSSWLKVDPRDPLEDTFTEWCAKLPYVPDLGKKLTALPASSVDWNFGASVICVDALEFKGILFFNTTVGPICSIDKGATWHKQIPSITAVGILTNLTIFNNELYFTYFKSGNPLIKQLWKSSNGTDWTEVTGITWGTSVSAIGMQALKDRLIIIDSQGYGLIHRIDKEGNITSVTAKNSATEASVSISGVGWYTHPYENIAVAKTNGAMWYSEDFGEHWTIALNAPTNNQFSFPGLDINPLTKTQCFASVKTSGSSSSTVPLHIYRSTDGLKTFTEVYTASTDKGYTSGLNCTLNCVNGVWFFFFGQANCPSLVSLDDGLTWQTATFDSGNGTFSRRVGYTNGVYLEGKYYSKDCIHWYLSDTVEASANNVNFACLGCIGKLFTLGATGVNETGVQIWLPPEE